ncbi:MAG: hypothetical protein ABIJ05_00275 [Patescibacteria group bacterium]
MGRDKSFPDILKNKFSESQLKQDGTYLFEVLENTERLQENIQNRSLVLLISGPSGSGKDSIIDLLPENFARAKTCTSRPIRKAEVKNDPYIRLSVEEFKKGIEDGSFLETNIYDDNYYGSKISEIKKVLSLGKTPILRLDASGAKNVLEILKKNLKSLKDIGIIYFFIVPPSKKILKERIVRRDVKTTKGILKKMELWTKANKRFKGTVEKDLNLIKHAHFILINHNGKLEEATDTLVKKFESFS